MKLLIIFILILMLCSFFLYQPLNAQPVKKLKIDNFEKSKDKKIKFEIESQNNKIFSGTLLYAEDSLLVLWQGNSLYNPNKLTDFGKLIYYWEIQQITFKKDGHFWKGVGYGALIGAGSGALIGLTSGDDDEGLFSMTSGEKAILLGAICGGTSGLVGGIIGAAKGVDEDHFIGCDKKTFQAFLPKFKSFARFRLNPPEELLEFLNKPPQAKTNNKILKPRQSDKTSKFSSAGKFHISICGQITSTAANNNISDAFDVSGFGGTYTGWFGTTDYPTDHSNPFSWNIEAAYNFTNQLRVGLEYNSFPHHEIHGTGGELEETRGSAFSFLITFLPKPVDPRFISRWELSLQAGVDYNFLDVNGRLDYDNN